MAERTTNPDSSDSDASGDSRPLWRVEGSRPSDAARRKRAPHKRPSAWALDEADAYAAAGVPRPEAAEQPVAAYV